MTAREDDWIPENLRRNPDAKMWADIERGEPAEREIENDPELANEAAMADYRSPNREWLKDVQINDGLLSGPVGNKSQANRPDTASTKKRLLQSSAEFVAAYEPPDLPCAQKTR